MAHIVDVRAADVDRERVMAELQQHTSAGRLSMDEFSERVAAVYRSRTLGELDALTADLPVGPNLPEDSRFSSSLCSALLWIGLITALVGVPRWPTAAHWAAAGDTEPFAMVIVDARAAQLVAVLPVTHRRSTELRCDDGSIGHRRWCGDPPDLPVLRRRILAVRKGQRGIGALWLKRLNVANAAVVVVTTAHAPNCTAPLSRGRGAADRPYSIGREWWLLAERWPRRVYR